jgi:hypothetical protein
MKSNNTKNIINNSLYHEDIHPEVCDPKRELDRPYDRQLAKKIQGVGKFSILVITGSNSSFHLSITSLYPCSD